MSRQNLGVLATQLAHCARAVDDLWNDPITQHYGCGSELTPLVHRAAQQRALEACRAHGFLTITHAVCAIEAATTDGWMYRSGLLSLIPEHEDIIV